MAGRTRLALVATCALMVWHGAGAQTPATVAALKGLAPVTVLNNSYAGRAALAANLAVTGGIQTGTLRQSTLLPFPAQQQQALRDAFITDGNLSQLADGLGTTLGSAYQARAHYNDRDHFTSISANVAGLIAYSNYTAGGDSNAGKYFFANGTTNGRTPVSAEVAQILKDNGGVQDAFGVGYGRPGGSAGADVFGNSRPFQTEPVLAPVVGPDYFNVPGDNNVYNRGPVMNLVDSPSYPSGHTTYGYMGSIVLAVLVPERFQQMIARGSEYGNDRILIGAHYAMDVLGGRTLATYDMAHLLANDPAYMNRQLGNGGSVAVPIPDYRAAITAARADMVAALQAGCGKTMSECAKEDIGRFNDPASSEASYLATQTYNLPVVYPAQAGKFVDYAQVAPEAGYLLTVAFPYLSMEQANRILTETQGPGGGFLDDGSAFGAYSRINLYAAGGRAAMLAPK